MPKRNKKKVNKSMKRNRADVSAAAASSLLAADKKNVQYLASPRKSDLDQHEYRALLLSNGLKVILVSMPEDDAANEANENTSEPANDESSKNHLKLRHRFRDYEQGEEPECYLSINVGAMSNPRQVPYVSSVLSTVFENVNFDFLENSDCETSDSDDSSDHLDIYASESWEQTTFNIVGEAGKFREMLETFMRSVVNAAPSRDLVEAEWNRRADPSWAENHYTDAPTIFRAKRVFAELAATRHPLRIAADYFHAFDHMPMDKLCMDVMKFRKRHYSANRMAVLLKAELPLDTLETYAIETFSRIPSNDLPPLSFEPYNFGNSFDNTKLSRIWIAPDVYDDFSLHTMRVHWIMPPSRWLYKVKSLDYLAWIFSGTGAGTLQQYLINKNWAQKVVATIPEQNPWNTSLYSTFTIAIDLSDEGNNHIINILDAIYSYINFLQREGPQREIYEGIRMNADAKFRFDPEGELRDCNYLCTITKGLHLYEPADYLSGPYLFYQYDPVSIRTCTELMAPAKGCVFMNNDKFLVPFKNDEHLLGDSVGRRSFGFPEEFIERWRTIAPLPEFNFPGANEFWPDDLTIIEPPETFTKNPSIVYSDAVSEVWYKFDPSERAPRCHMNLCYASPLPLESAENSVMLTYFAKVLQTLISNESELAKEAGLFSTIKVHSSKLVIAVHGFRQKLPLLMETIARYVRESHFRLTNKLFQFVRFTSYEEYARTWSAPCQLAENIRQSILMPGRWTVTDNYNALLAITFAQFRNFLEKFTNDIHVKCLVQGNVSESLAVATARRVIKLSKCKVSSSRPMPGRCINEIPPGTHRCKIKIGKTNEKAPSQYLINYYQFEDSTVERAVLIDALELLFHDYRFRKLSKIFERTENRINVKKDDYSVNNWRFNLENGRDRCNDIGKIGWIEKSSFKRFSSALTDSVWEQFKLILIAGPICNCRDEFEHIWNEIIHGEPDFDRHSRKIDAITKSKAANFVDFLKQLANNRLAVRKLSIMIIGYGTHWKTDKIINSLNYKFRLGNFQKFPLLSLEYLTGSGEGNGKSPDHYITDVSKYKNELERRLE